MIQCELQRGALTPAFVPQEGARHSSVCLSSERTRGASLAVLATLQQLYNTPLPSPPCTTPPSTLPPPATRLAVLSAGRKTVNKNHHSIDVHQVHATTDALCNLGHVTSLLWASVSHERFGLDLSFLNIFGKRTFSSKLLLGNQ